MGEARGVGGELRALRQARRISMAQVAAWAGVSRASVANWEAGSHAPRGPGLGRLLDALEVDARTRARLLHALDPAFARVELSAGGLGAPVHVGLVLRAMRRRREMAQADLARTVGANQSTVARWESGDLTPSGEMVHALCFALGATPEECAALMLGADAGAAPLPDDPAEAATAVRTTISDCGTGAFEVVSLDLEARLWARASRDARWDAALCSVVSARSVKLFIHGRLDEAQEAARRALRFDPTPEVRVAATQAVSALLEVATLRGAEPARLAERIGAWAERLPDGEFKGWMLWERALRLAETGRDAEALDLTERMAEMEVRAKPFLKSFDHEITRLGGLLPIDIRSGRPDRAEARLPEFGAAEASSMRAYLEDHPSEEAMVLQDSGSGHARWRVEIAHARRIAADEADLETLRRCSYYGKDWYARHKRAKLERTQAGLLAAGR